MRASDAIKISAQDDSGVKDIIRLNEFSPESMLYTLRVRYTRDEIYTMVGPILISINPYKQIADLYSEGMMLDYHSKKQVDNVKLFILLVQYFSLIAVDGASSLYNW